LEQERVSLALSDALSNHPRRDILPAVDFLMSAYHTLAGLPHWAWVAFMVTAMVAVVWAVVDILSFIVVSVLSFALGIAVLAFGWSYLTQVF
jgi:hypothetical protein